RHPTVATLLAMAILLTIASVCFGLWYWDHLRTLERIAERHEAKLREETAEDLLHAQKAISKHELDQGYEILASRQRTLGRESSRGLASLADQTRQMLTEVEAARGAERAQAEVQARYRLFQDRRK